MAVLQFGSGSALGCLLIFASFPFWTSGTPVVQFKDSDGGRRSLQTAQSACPHQFAVDNFTILFSACPSPNSSNDTNAYPKGACCAALATMLCPYASLDPNSPCASSYWSILSGFGNYTSQPEQFFEVICTNVHSQLPGIPCPNGTVSDDTSTPSRSSPVPRGLSLALLGMLLAFELVISYV